MKSKAILIAIVVLVMSVFVGAVAAQDDAPPVTDRPQREGGILSEIMSIITDATGLTAQEVLTQLADGATLTEIIQNAGGDVDAVMAEVEAYMSTQIEVLFTTEFDFAGRGEGIRDRIHNGVMGEVISAVTDATGLEATEILQQMRDGATLADIITENGGDVDVVITSIVDAITTAITERVESGQITQAQADVILENLEANVTDVINGEINFPNRPNRRGRGNN